MIQIKAFTLILLFIAGCFVILGGSLEASDDIDRQMGYINSLTSSNLPTLSLESSLPTVDTPPIVVQEQAEVSIAYSEEAVVAS